MTQQVKKKCLPKGKGEKLSDEAVEAPLVSRTNALAIAGCSGPWPEIPVLVHG